MNRRGGIVAALVAAILALATAGGGLAAPPGHGDALRLTGHLDAGDRQLALTAASTDGRWRLAAALAPAGRVTDDEHEDDEHEDGKHEDDEHEGDEQHEQSSRRAADGVIGGGPGQWGGRFTLAGPGGLAVQGEAAGVVDQAGSGTLELLDDTGAADMTATFGLDQAGALVLDLRGVPATAPAGADAAAPASAPPAQGTHAFWYLARAAGLSAYVLLFLTVCLGLGVQLHFLDALLARWRTFDLHEFAALLALGFVALHALALLGDRYTGFTLPQLLVPLASPYRPVWTALGVLAFYLFAAITASFYLRRRIGQRAWRALHYLTYAVFLLALAHGLFAGSDAATSWARALYWGTAAAVAVLTVRRVRGAGRRPSAARRPHPAPGAGVSRP
ncbi:MAG TPA: hypothetical protein VFW96_13615 [Thermomicrobiales bacterium]|nr:hypothetical protein [Thermomicrobiales bacterium]